jgi:hypothetical protein
MRAFGCPPLEGVSCSDGGGICFCEERLARRGNLMKSCKYGIAFILSFWSKGCESLVLIHY